MEKLGWTLLMLAVLAFIYINFLDTYSTGTRVGHVVKLSERGFVIKTWEAQLDVAGTATDLQGRVLWEFSVDDDEVAKQVDAAQTKGKRVKIFYHEEVYVAPWRGDTNYIADKVEIVER
jgi:hypothetical protein